MFDNIVLIREEKGYALLEPVPLRRTAPPPLIPDRVKPGEKTAVVYMTDVYNGPGLEGVPRGTVKNLRVYELHYAYTGMGGHINIGIDGPWDARRILGTVPVHSDGSAMFIVPANTPIAVQPLDAEGKAIQVMRSWMVARPGEVLSCAGCHERQNTAPPAARTMAGVKPPEEIRPWRGPPRGFSFKREVQPVLDKYCIACHNGQEGRPDLRIDGKERFKNNNFTPSYVALHPYVRRPGPESDYHLQKPMEYHADGSELVQMLRRGHGRVELDEEAWGRLITWIDLNVPDHGTWREQRAIPHNFDKRRLDMQARYAWIEADPERIIQPSTNAPSSVAPAPKPQLLPAPAVKNWPFGAAAAARLQAGAGTNTVRKVRLAEGIDLELTLIPAGEFVMGAPNGPSDQRPPVATRIDKPFWMGRFEITNRQFELFDPTHDSGFISVYNKDVSTRGIPANLPGQPVIRVSRQEAEAFCRWLSERTGLSFSLPTEAQWEWACRAGTDTLMNYGDTAADFSRLANFADRSISILTRRDSPPWIPRIDSVNDKASCSAPVGRYEPNAWGLYDMHGNVSEWTSSDYTACLTAKAKDAPAGARKVVRGGSFYDRPKRGTSAYRGEYQPWQKIFDVGFRVACEM